MTENGPKTGVRIFFGKQFLLFFVTYQGLTRYKKSKKSKARILRSGGRTDAQMDGQGQIYSPNLQSRWVQKLSLFQLI